MKLAENKVLRGLIVSRMTELDMSPAEMIKDVGERGMKITPSSFSKYKKGLKGGMTDEQVLFVSCRLYIPISVNFGLPEYNGKELRYVVPKFDQLAALKLLKQIYGKNG